MNKVNDKTEFRLFVKILFSETGKAALANVHYFRNEMTVPFFQRWSWYFEYKAALLRVKYPKAFIKYEQGSYVYELPDDKYREKVRSIYLSNKRQMSKFNNRLDEIRRNWNQIFPIEDHPEYKKVIEKLNYYQKQLDESQKAYDSLFKPKQR